MKTEPSKQEIIKEQMLNTELRLSLFHKEQQVSPAIKAHVAREKKEQALQELIRRGASPKDKYRLILEAELKAGI